MKKPRELNITRDDEQSYVQWGIRCDRDWTLIQAKIETGRPSELKRIANKISEMARWIELNGNLEK